MFNGITGVLKDRKWVFAYILLGLSIFYFDKAQATQILIILIPVTLGVNAFEKSQWRQE